MENENNVLATKHSFVRAKERMCIKNPKEYDRMIRLAFERGKCASDMRRSAEKKYLFKKTSNGVIAKAFAGFCFIFSRDGVCITQYHLPHFFREEYSRSPI